MLPVMLSDVQEYDVEMVELGLIETPDGWDIAEHALLGFAAGVGFALVLGC